MSTSTEEHRMTKHELARQIAEVRCLAREQRQQAFFRGK
jgi:hypothetical protein